MTDVPRKQHDCISDSEEAIPIKALGMVILSHILSLMSSPESGEAITFTTVTISVLIVSASPSGSSVYPAKEFISSWISLTNSLHQGKIYIMHTSRQNMQRKGKQERTRQTKEGCLTLSLLHFSA